MTEKRYMKLITAVSIIIPAVVAILIFKPEPFKMGNIDVTILPLFHALINGTVSILLIVGLLLIKRKNITLHRIVMITALILSVVFLVSYVIYHSNVQPTPFGGDGFIRIFYYFILISHILLAVAVIPLALISLFRGLSMDVERHKKIVRWAWPVWFYVSITGVLVYILISPYYS